jgi:hypothetical protein
VVVDGRLGGRWDGSRWVGGCCVYVLGVWGSVVVCSFLQKLWEVCEEGCGRVSVGWVVVN